MTEKQSPAKTPGNREYGVEHSPTCASGDRAEARGVCDCVAVDARPWRLRVVEPTEHDPVQTKAEVHVITDRELTMREACDLALSLLELTRIEGEKWSRKECSRLEREAKALREAKPAEVFDAKTVAENGVEDDEVPPWER